MTNASKEVTSIWNPFVKGRNNSFEYKGFVQMPGEYAQDDASERAQVTLKNMLRQF